MKELSIEQKAKSYDEALERAKKLYEQGTITESLSYVFPELKESEDERIRKAIVATIHLYYGEPLEDEAKEMIAWLEKQKTSEEALQYLRENHSSSEMSDFQAAMNIAVAKAYDKGYNDGLEKQGETYTKKDIDNAYIEGMAFAKDELEKQGKQKGYTFKSIPRLLDMIEPSDKAKAYCQKLIDALAKEGYNTDAKIVEEVLKGWNGEDVPMAVMDEQKPFDYENANIQQTDFAPKVDMPRYSIGDVLCDKSCTTLDKEAQPNFEIIDIRNGMYICDKCSFPISQQDEYELVAKKIEQKPTDKVKPKFKVGDWVVQENIGVYKVIEVCESWYEVIDGEDNHYSISFDNEYMCHLWDITKDAEDGDVLVDRFSKDNIIILYKGINPKFSILAYCGWNGYNLSIKTNGLGYGNLDNTNYLPATKEQRDTMLKAMANARYTFDFEKKELNKIEQKPTNEEMKTLLRTEYEKGRADAIAEMQKPAWSEEDERIFEQILQQFMTANNDCKLHNASFTYDKEISFLKSLKGRVQPKQEWSEEDESYLNTTIAYLKDAKEFKKSAENCINWLKSLKDRVQPILRRRHTIFDEII